MNKSTKKKSEKLGMNFSTAMHQLRKEITFRLVQKCGLDVCYRCNRPIGTADELSYDHKTDWLNSDSATELFWDLDNVTFSHKSCNTQASNEKRSHGGVTKLKNRQNKKYQARYWNGHRQVFVGVFATAEEAQRASAEAKQMAP